MSSNNLQQIRSGHHGQSGFDPYRSQDSPSILRRPFNSRDHASGFVTNRQESNLSRHGFGYSETLTRRNPLLRRKSTKSTWTKRLSSAAITDYDEGDYTSDVSCSHVLGCLKRVCVGGKNLVVPPGTFGKGTKARRTEWCALCVFLSLWIPVYIILIYVCIAIWLSDWIEGMSVQTSYVNRLPIPSVIFCPKEFRCGMSTVMYQQPNRWSQVFSNFGHPTKTFPSPVKLSGLKDDGASPPSILPTGELNLTFSKLGYKVEISQKLDGYILHTCGCGHCVCLRSFLLNFTSIVNPSQDSNRILNRTDHKDRFNRTRAFIRRVFPGFFDRYNVDRQKAEVIKLTPEFESLASAPSETRALHQGSFNIKGVFNTGRFRTISHERSSSYDDIGNTPHCSAAVKAHGHIRVGLYGQNVPLTEMGFPQRPSWISLAIDTSVRALFRLNRVRLDQQGFWSIVTSMMHMWAPFLIQYHRWNPQRSQLYAEHHEYRIAITPSTLRVERKQVEFQRVGNHFIHVSREKKQKEKKEILTSNAKRNKIVNLESRTRDRHPSLHQNGNQKNRVSVVQSHKSILDLQGNNQLQNLQNLAKTSSLYSSCTQEHEHRYIIPETTLSIGVMTFFQREQARVGTGLSLLATLVLAGVFLVLIHRIGAFFVCFRRHEVRHPRLMVSPLLKKITGGAVSENHMFGRLSYEDLTEQQETP